MSQDDLSQLSLLDLFRREAEGQVQVLTTGLLALERDPVAADQLEACMRAAHSLKGAARIVGLDAGADLTHAMEDCFVAAQQGRIRLNQAQIDTLLGGVDLLAAIAGTPRAEPGPQAIDHRAAVQAFLAAMAGLSQEGRAPAPEQALAQPLPAPPLAAPAPAPAAQPLAGHGSADRVLRVTADHLDRLLGLAGESLVASRRLKPFMASLRRLKRAQGESGRALDQLRERLSQQDLDERTHAVLSDAQRHLIESQHLLSQQLLELEMFDQRGANRAHRLYDEALACRMRPFADGVQGFARMVRDLGQALGKQVRLEIGGLATQVDRDILEKLDAPLGHLLRNAVDHGIETPPERRAADKPAEGLVRLEASHSAGMLQISVSDDGRGIDLKALREAVAARGLTNAETASRMGEGELLEFLFLPGFSMKGSVTQISGRGVGLDAVQDMIRQVRGTVRVSSRHGAGMRFQLLLPLTLSVVRALLVEIAGEPYAIPLTYIERTLKLPKERIELLEGRQHFSLDGQQVGLVGAHQVLGRNAPDLAGDELPVVVLGGAHNRYGLVVSRLLGERELVVQPLDARLGKIQDISAGAVMEDGSPALIIDVEDMLRSVDKLVATGHLSQLQRGAATSGDKRARKRVLVVDDSLTVRELERKLLGQRGYEVEVAVDGMDGWNAVRTGHFDLVVTDIDMPRMNGIELVTLVKKDANLKSLPMMIVSYKDREDDRRRGLEAGADYYLTKGSFHDETLLQAVVDLIGEALA